MINIIASNPFRLLGVYSNAKQTDIVRNFSKMKAYLTVGKNVKFPADMDFLLSPIGRTMELAQKAQSDINLPKDRIRYALFWFCKGNPMDEVALNNLANQAVGKAVEILGKRTTYSSLINMAVIALVQERYADAVNCYSQVVHDESNRTQFITAICSDTFQISEEDLSHILFDELLKDIKPTRLLQLVSNDDDKVYIKEKAVEGPIFLINNEIAKAKGVQATDAAASLRAGNYLIQHTKSALASLKTIIGADDARYQSSADNLARQVLQCGINYFNNSEDTNAVDNTLKLQEYALSLACGKLMKDRCKKNVDILRKRKQQEVFEEDIKAIAAALNVARDGIGSISKSRQLLDSCDSHLEVLKYKMGASDSNYLQISSAVANNALSLVIAEVNRNTDSRSTAKSAQEVITRIQGMDMDAQTRSRVTQNASIISSNIAMMPTGFEKVDNATGGCLGGILGYIILGGIIALIGGIASLF